MRAVIMAGGFGTRLRPLSCNIPKPMVPMANRPMMEHIVRLLARHGFQDLVVLLYYQAEVVMQHFGDGSAWKVRIQYLRPDSDLGTAGCVKFAAAHLSETFLVISGDVLTDFDLTAAVQAHRRQKAIATLVLTRVTNPLPYGVIVTDREGRILRFLEKPSWGEVFSDTINTGIYVLEPAAIERVPSNREFDFSKNLFPLLLQEGEALFGHVAEGYWKDIGNLTEYRLAHLDILQGRLRLDIPGKPQQRGEATLLVGERAHVAKGVRVEGRVIVGDHAEVAEGATLGQCVLGRGVRVEKGAVISGSVLWDKVRVEEEARIQNAVVGRETVVGKGALLDEGAVISDACVIGQEAVVQANVKVWPHKRIDDGAVLSSSFVWGERWTRHLFGAYGITGLCNIEVTPDFACKVGAAYGAYLGSEAYVITSRDAHMASRMIKRAIISGLLSTGVRVGDLRTAPIPVVRYEMGKEGETGGVHVRQSPFDPALVDIKFFDKTGADISVEQERSIEQLFLREDFKRAAVHRVGEIITPPRAQEYYKAGFLRTVDAKLFADRPVKIVIDYAFSSAALLFPEILGNLGMEVVALNAYLNPHRVTKTHEDFQASLDQLSSVVRMLKASAGFLIDTGAGKVFIVDGRGQRVPDDVALALVARLVAEESRGGKMGVPVNVSGVLDRMVAPFGVQIQRVRTHPRYVMAAAREPGMRFVGDGIGGFIFPEFQPCFDAMYAIVKITELLVRHKTSLHALAAEVPAFETLHQKVPCPWDRKGQVMRRAIEAVQSQPHELVDGVKIFLDDGWVLLLPDPDEATFHVWAESQNKSSGQGLLKEYAERVKAWQNG